MHTGYWSGSKNFEKVSYVYKADRIKSPVCVGAKRSLTIFILTEPVSFSILRFFICNAFSTAFLD